MNLIKDTLLEFLKEDSNGKKILSIFYVFNDLLYRAKNSNNKII